MLSEQEKGFIDWAKMHEDPSLIDWSTAQQDFQNIDLNVLMSELGVSAEKPEAPSFFQKAIGTYEKMLVPMVPEQFGTGLRFADEALSFLANIPKDILGIAKMPSDLRKTMYDVLEGRERLDETAYQILVRPLENLGYLISPAVPMGHPEKKKRWEELRSGPLAPVWSALITTGFLKKIPTGRPKMKARPVEAKVEVPPMKEVPRGEFPEPSQMMREVPKPELPIEKPVPGAEALQVTKDMKERLAGEAGAVLDPFTEISRKTSEMIERARAPVEVRAGVAESKKAMIEHDVQIRSAEFTRMQFEDIVERNIPKDRQMLMTHAYEHKMKGKYWDQLDPLERKITEWAAGEKTKLNQFIKENNVLEMMPEQAGINHIFHHWIDPKTGWPYEAMYGKFSKGLPQAKQRTIPTYETGMTAGLEPATPNLGKLIGLEWESVMRAHQSRRMFETLYNIGADPKVAIQLRAGKAPKPIRMIERWDKLQGQGLTDGYVRYDHWALDKTIAFRDASGALVKLKGAVGVRKELFPFVKAYLENPNYQTLDALNFASKNLKLGLSMFHPIQLGWQEVCLGRVPFVHIPKGLRQIKELSPELRILYEQGLDIRKGYEDYGYRSKFFKGATLLGKAGNVVTLPVTGMRSLIFDYIQPGQKVSFAMHRYEKLLPKYLERGLTKEQCARDVVRAADSHFSHEHYKRSSLETNRWVTKAFFSPGSRRFWQRTLLSFTWQRSHLRVAGAVGKSFMTDKMIRRLHLQELGPIKADYRRYAIGAAALISTADAYNYIATKEMDGEGKHIWENPKGKGFAVRALWNEPSYTITTRDGKSKTIPGGAAYFRPLKSVFEVAEWVSDPFKKAGYKLSPGVTAVAEQFFPSKYRREYEGFEDIPRRALDFTLEVGTPIMTSQIARALKGERTPQTAALPFFGFPTSKEVEKKLPFPTLRAVP